jgi:hypothetical protein
MMQPYRDFWEMLHIRDVNKICLSIELFERLEVARKELFPSDGPQSKPWRYWSRDRVGG